MRIGLAAALTGVLVLSWTAGPANAAIGATSQDGTVLARFATVKCKLKNSSHFVATGEAGDWKLQAHILPFNGFQTTYEIEYGLHGSAKFSVNRPGLGGSYSYSSLWEPETDAPPDLTVGGSMAFKTKNKHRRFGIQFPIAYNAANPPSWVTVLGFARCT